MAKDLTAIRIDGTLIESLKRIVGHAPKDSVYRDRSVNWLIGRAIEEFIERNRDLVTAATEQQAKEDAAWNEMMKPQAPKVESKRVKPLGRKPKIR
jgi:hypothetical protein